MGNNMASSASWYTCLAGGPNWRRCVQVLTVGYQVPIGVGKAREGQQGQHDRQQAELGSNYKA